MSQKVSVIMGVYNCADTLNESLDSIVCQTYGNWNMIICDDGSTDNTHEIALMYAKAHPDRIILLKNDTNMGLNHSLNRCLAIADGQYIARQDGDDTSMPTRLEKEVELLDRSPHIAIVSTAMVFFDEHGEWGVYRRTPEPGIHDLILNTPFAHAASMVRAEAVRQVGGYSVSERLLRVEDYHLWYKMYKAGFRGVNIEDPLYRCRDDRDAQKRRKFRYRINESYVKWQIMKDFRLPVRYLPLLAKPLVIGLLPGALYRMLHRNRVNHA